MVKHIVMWKLLEQAQGGTLEENAAQIKTRLEALVGVIDGLVHLEVGRNTNPKGEFDLVLYSEFVDKAALEAYDVHPAHQQVRQFVRSVISQRTVADFVV